MLPPPLRSGHGGFQLVHLQSGFLDDRSPLAGFTFDLLRESFRRPTNRAAEITALLYGVAMGLTFEVPLVLLVLVQLGVVRAETIRKGRKVCIAVAVIISAVVAPPDPLSMVLLAIPLIALFEVTIWIAWLLGRRKQPPLAP